MLRIYFFIDDLFIMLTCSPAGSFTAILKYTSNGNHIVQYEVHVITFILFKTNYRKNVQVDAAHIYHIS